jgi:hypothetical protein
VQIAATATQRRITAAREWPPACIAVDEPIASGRFDTNTAPSSPMLIGSPPASPMPSTICSGIPSRNAPTARAEPAPPPLERRSRERPAPARATTPSAT